MVKKGLIGILLTVCLLGIFIVIMHVDVKNGVKQFGESHPIRETATRNADISIFKTGESFYEALFEDCKAAEEHIWIHFFIIRDDSIANELFDLLIEKAQRGVDVRLSVDFLGSDIRESTVKKLREGGVYVLKSRPARIQNISYSLHHRNHRRLISIDQQIGYIGGFNMGEEYLGKDPNLGYWRDYHLRLNGSAVYEISRQFAMDWKEDGGGHIPYPLPPESPFKESGSPVKFLFSSGEGLVDKTVGWINRAEESVTITTPYFIPDENLVSALKDAVERGVKVNVLVPDDTDAWFTKPPSYAIEEELLTSGVNFYLYQKGFFHGKVIIIDHQWADVGTANWDSRSFHLNDESNAIIQDAEVALKLEALINEDMEDSAKLTMESFDQLPIWQWVLKSTPGWLSYYF
ncbi:cardiolipin synthase [Bacillus sp. KH172YL63]|uniref:cardiolipin synthase n=1 Tax=Bacillus sp. KH172YL63 TaxID=2709784 RepID=UPI0013E42A15|nr:cardiolipin synthase [Bacillus sp. KH172YL63]BCB03549.1 cardiolipin synthase [Bacillus sp. KH172YL63]